MTGWMAGTMLARRVKYTTLSTMLRASVVGAGLALLAACGGADDVRILESEPVEELYNRGLDQMAQNEFAEATRSFDEVERQHPFSVWAPRAQLMSAYAHFRADQYDDAVNALDRFIQLHPSHEDAAYAHYLKAVTYYEQIVDVVRDQAITRQALAALNDVIRRYPDTQYSRDAKLKRDLAVDHLAGKEMQIGRYYQREGSLVAAMNRFTHVLVNYQTTTHAPEALHRLVESHLVLGMKDEARKYAAVLGHNFPSSSWYADSYELLTGERVEVSFQPDNRDFIDRSLDFLFSPNYQIGSIDPDAEVLGTRIEAQTLQVSLSQGSTYASVPGGESSASLDLAGQVASTVGELPPPGGADNSERTRSQIDQLRTSAGEQRLAAEQSAAGWREFASSQTQNQTARARGESQFRVATAAANYWQARENLLAIAADELRGQSVDPAVRAEAEVGVAEAGLTYWRTVARDGLTPADREQATKNAIEAEQALTFWRSSGRSWLDRLLSS